MGPQIDNPPPQSQVVKGLKVGSPFKMNLCLYDDEVINEQCFFECIVDVWKMRDSCD